MTDNEIKTICKKIDSLHEKILSSKFAEVVTESEILSLILAVQELNRQKAEIERLEYTLIGVMHSVDKWLEGEELEQDEVNRAIAMREKTLQIVEEKQEEIERLEKLYKLAVAERDANVKGFTEGLNAIKSKAIKEFAEMVCEGRVSNDPVVIAVRCAVKAVTDGEG